jgi:hypothetical protein
MAITPTLVLSFCVKVLLLQITKPHNQMKKLIALAAAALASSAYAQLNPLPPSSTTDGVLIKAIGADAGTTNWDATPGLASYKFTSDATLGSPKPGTPDNVLGLNWSTNFFSSAAGTADFNKLNTNGGIMRAIFVGESAGWLNDFGYTYSGNPQSSSSFTVFQNIQAATGTPYPVNVTYGDHVDITLGAGQATNFDFWLNAVGGDGINPALPPTTYGGVYTGFHPGNSTPFNAPGNVSWTTTPLLTSTFVPTYTDSHGVIVPAHYEDIDTYLMSFEDWRTDRGSDNDRNDFMVAIQFLNVNGGADTTPVPEPSTYGLIGAAALLGLVAVRRFKAKK